MHTLFCIYQGLNLFSLNRPTGLICLRENFSQSLCLFVCAIKCSFLKLSFVSQSLWEWWLCPPTIQFPPKKRFPASPQKREKKFNPKLFFFLFLDPKNNLDPRRKWCYYPHRWRNSVFPECKIFTNSALWAELV